MVAGYSNRRYDYNSPTASDLTGTTVTNGSRVIYIVDTRSSNTTTGTALDWPVSQSTYASLPLPVPTAELLRQQRLIQLREDLRKLREDLDKSLKSDRALRRLRCAAEVKLPPKRHPHERARHGFQQMCRIPCYRGVRTR